MVIGVLLICPLLMAIKRGCWATVECRKGGGPTIPVYCGSFLCTLTLLLWLPDSFLHQGTYQNEAQLMEWLLERTLRGQRSLPYMHMSHRKEHSSDLNSIPHFMLIVWSSANKWKTAQHKRLSQENHQSWRLGNRSTCHPFERKHVTNSSITFTFPEAPLRTSSSWMFTQ